MDPPSDGASLTHTTMKLKIHQPAMSTAANHLQVYRAATPYESRS
jgi:hypothetical protein